MESPDSDGFQFSIYDRVDRFMVWEAIDGGVCTSTFTNAVEMAADQAKTLLRRTA